MACGFVSKPNEGFNLSPVHDQSMEYFNSDVIVDGNHGYSLCIFGFVFLDDTFKGGESGPQADITDDCLKICTAKKKDVRILF